MPIDGASIITWIIVGGVAGWLAGLLVQGGGFGLIGDIVIGIVGAIILLAIYHFAVGRRGTTAI